LGTTHLLEKELKYELSKSDYQKLIRVFKSKRPRKLNLTNYYFDDSDLRLRKKKFALRIRIIDKKTCLFTLKYPAKQPVHAPRALKVRVEHEVAIPLKTGKQLLRNGKRVIDVDAEPIRILRRSFSKSALSKVRPLGLIETQRTMVKVSAWLELEIDRCKMFDQKFYEVEIETSQARRVDREVRAIFAAHGIPYHPLTRSKFSRFLEEWKSRNQKS
jgi:uncharacterized protein YjbK